MRNTQNNCGKTMTPWREDPKLQSRFHPDFPDDIQVLVRIQFKYDGEHIFEFLGD